MGRAAAAMMHALQVLMVHCGPQEGMLSPLIIKQDRRVSGLFLQPYFTCVDEGIAMNILAKLCQNNIQWRGKEETRLFHHYGCNVKSGICSLQSHKSTHV